jgi:hypothetical protein
MLAMLAVTGGAAAVSLAQEKGPQQPWSLYKVNDMSRPKPPVVEPAPAPAEPVKPPSDAIVLFDGKDLSKWTADNGTEPTWTVADGAMTVAGRAGIKTKDKFGDCQLHVEWASPNPPKGTSQGRGNSGIYIMGLFETQVLDNYKADTYPDGQAGSVYGQYPPLVNACRPPGEWQTYDIMFTKPIYKDGKLDSPAYVTVIQNGVVVQMHRALHGPTVNMKVAEYPAKPIPEFAPISLQNHGGDQVKYRNIWIRPLEKLEIQADGKTPPESTGK